MDIYIDRNLLLFAPAEAAFSSPWTWKWRPPPGNTEIDAIIDGCDGDLRRYCKKIWAEVTIKLGSACDSVLHTRVHPGAGHTASLWSQQV